MRKLEWLNILNSPFKRPTLKFYFGKLAHGTPYFYPRRWRKYTLQEALDKATEIVGVPTLENEKWTKYNEVRDRYLKGYLKAVPKKVGWDLVGLGWKTKWDDYRFEWSPMFSFVFFKWQFCIFVMGHSTRQDNYWEAWLYYHYRTSGNKLERLLKTMEDNPLTYQWSDGRVRGYECDWPYVLKDEYVSLGEEVKQKNIEKIR